MADKNSENGARKESKTFDEGDGDSRENQLHAGDSKTALCSSPAVNRLGTRWRWGAVRARFYGCLEFPQRILGSQEHDFAGGFVHAFRDPQHPAYRFDFYAQIQFRAIGMETVFQLHRLRCPVQILAAIANPLNARLYLFCQEQERFMSFGVHAESVIRCAIRAISDKHCCTHRAPPDQNHRGYSRHKHWPTKWIGPVLRMRERTHKLLQLGGLESNSTV